MIQFRRYLSSQLTTAVLLLCVGWSAAATSSAADLLSDAEWASVRAQMEAHRHRAEGDAVDGYRAYNPVLGLSQRFHPDGRIQVEGQRLQVSMRLTGYGYGELVQPGRPELRAETDAQGAVVHYQWDRNLREWWHNRPGTLEQWFELQQRPAGADGSPLRLQMALTVPEQARVHLDATGQVLRVGEGEGALQYAGLKVWDADGQILPARMQLSEVDQLLLSVDDTRARYPLTIDPVWSQEVYFKASNAEQGDEFGYSVALSSSASGDTLVVGAPFEDGGLEGPGSNTSPLSGAVYVFVRLGGGQWLQQAYLKTSSIDGGGGDRFGEAVALSGETLVVGAPFERSRATGVNGDQLDNSRIESGAAYVFVRDGGMTGNWSQQAYLKASNTDFFDRFGSAVAVSGALVVVGAPGEGSSATGLNGDQSNNDAESSGAVYVFRRTQASGNWLQEAYLKASNTAAEDRFGSAVAIEGFTVIAGAPGEDSDATGINGDQANNGAGNSGAVYIFTRSELLVGDWSQQAYLKASNSGAGDAFGHALAISGESLVVGAIGEASNATGVNGNQSDNSAVNSGAAYVYARTGGVFGSWSQQAYLKASNAQTGDGFGHAVALSGNLLAVGAINEDSNARGIDGDQANNALGSSGAAYAFVREAGLWRPQAYIKASNTAFGNQFGYAVAVSGPRLVVGARAEGSSGIGVNGVQGPPNGAVASGAVYGFLIEPTLSATVSGLAPGGSLTLRNAGGGQTRVVTVNGPVSFGTLPFDSPYDVSVTVQPTGQFCTVANGSGHAVSEVTDIEVNCAVGSFFVGGNLVGLNAGQSISLRNTDSGDVLTLTANAFFSFPTLHGPGNTYNVVVTSQPIGQTCIVGNGTGVVVGPVTSVVVLCQTNTYRIGGRVTQLGPGDSLTLGNGSDTLVITENGDFVFPTRIPHGASYAVTITAEPVGKTCEVESGAGVALGDVSDVLVRCVVNDYSIGGTVSGLDPGRNITLRLPNATVVVNSNGPFSFPGQPISHGFPYSVTVQTQPVGQLCMVSNGSGVATGDVTDLIVDCITNRYSIGGTLFGLAAGGSLTLQNNGGDDLVLGTDGAFAFPTQLLHGSPYAVTVASAPAGQSCVVNPDTGTATGTVTNIQVTCVNGNPVTIGGSLSGLAAGRSVRLQNNGRDDLILNGNGNFVFSAPIGQSESYLVTVATQPGGQVCMVSDGNGMATANVTNVSVSCVTETYTIGGTLSGLGANRSITLQLNVGETLTLDADGSFLFASPFAFGSFYSVSVSEQPMGQTCEVSGGGIVVGNVSTVEVICVSDSYLIGGTLSNLDAGGSITLQNNGGDDLTLGADGSFVFSAPVDSGTNYLVSVLAQPAGQRCTVSNASGVATANVTDVIVRCVCDRISFPYTLPDNVPATLIDAIACANDNDSADIIDLDGQSISLTGSLGVLTVLPAISSDISLRNGTITRAGENPVRFLATSGSGHLSLRDMVLSNGGGSSFPSCGGSVSVNPGGSLILINTRLSGSVSNADLGGGAICSAGTVTMVNSIISGNRARLGGGLAAYGGQVTISNSVMSGNVADTQGGAIYSEDSDVTLVNATVTGNHQSSDGAFSGADNHLALRNSIVWGNINASGGAVQIFNLPVTTGSTSVSNSLIQGGQFGALDADPLFLAPLTASATPSSAGNFQLSDDSPAIDAGANADVPADSLDVNDNGNTSEDAPDLAGNPRRVDDTAVADTGIGAAPIVDLGAFEKQSASVPQADLSISKTNGSTSSTPGRTTVYTITVMNAGPSDVIGATVTDNVPASLSCVWTCVGAGGASCVGSGIGSIHDSVDLPTGSSATYTADCLISAAATGTLTNTATVGSDIDDPIPGNNTATDSDTLTPRADVSISKTDGQASVNAGSATVYTITASNTGPSHAPAATVVDNFPAACVAPTWTCVGAGGGSCPASGSGNINQGVNLPAGGAVSFTASCPISGSASGVLSNTATVTSSATDPNPANNSATDTSAIIAPVVSISGGTITEGDSGTANLQFMVTRTSNGTSFDVTVTSSDGTAVAGEDYQATNTTLSFTAGGNFSEIVSVPIIGDDRVEASEGFSVTLSNPTSGAQLGTATAFGSIDDNDSATVQFAPLSVSQTESNTSMVFTVTLSAPVQSGVTLAANSTPDTATAPADFSAIAAASVSFAANSTEPRTVVVTLVDDALDEADEQFSLTLTGLTAVGNVTLPAGTATAAGTIVDDDDAPTLSLAEVSQPEGDAGNTLTFTASLSAISGREISFNRATLDDTAISTGPDADFVALPLAALTIPAGTQSVQIPVTINGDTTFEGDERFALNLTDVVNASPGSLSATATLIEDDQQPTTTTIDSITPGSIVVGQPYTVNVTVAALSNSPTGTLTVSDGSASCGPVPLVTGTSPSSSASCQLTSSNAGSQTLTAIYAPADTDFAASSGTASHPVNPASTTLSVSGPPRSRVQTPTPFAFTLVVNAPGGGTPSGTVTLSSGSSSCQVSVPAVSGCELSFDGLGPRTVSASFVSTDGHHLASSSSGASDAQTLVYAQSDLVVSKTDAVDSYVEGELLVYTITLRNLGPDRAENLRLRDMVPAGLVNVTWTCDSSGGASCPASSGSGDIDAQIAGYPVGALLNYSFFGHVAGQPEQILNTASVALPDDGTVEDAHLANNSASDLNRRNRLFADGFEPLTVSSAAGSLRLPSAALLPLLDGTARVIFVLDDAQVEAARVYARVFDGQLQYALARRDQGGLLWLGPWLAYSTEPLLSWSAVERAEGWVVQSVSLD